MYGRADNYFLLKRFRMPQPADSVGNELTLKLRIGTVALSFERLALMNVC